MHPPTERYVSVAMLAWRTQDFCRLNTSHVMKDIIVQPFVTEKDRKSCFYALKDYFDHQMGVQSNRSLVKIHNKCQRYGWRRGIEKQLFDLALK